MIITFGDDALEIAGNGRGISRDGWQRLSVIVGTGRVVGEADAERVEAKRNGIGSKNFGLRSLFLFGNEIYVRSGGQVAVLDLRTLETGKVRDPQASGEKGVWLRVPFRTETFELLEPFTVEREQRAFDVMAEEMLATLVKLALAGRRKGLPASRYTPPVGSGVIRVTGDFGANFTKSRTPYCLTSQPMKSGSA